MTRTDQKFYGWKIAILGFLITGCTVGLLQNCNGIFLKPVTEELGFLRSQLSLYSTISSITTVLLLPVFSELYSKFKLKNMLLLCGILMSMLYFSYSFASEIWHFYVIAVLIGSVTNGTTITIIGIIINNWFQDKRGIAAGIAFSGSGVFAATIIPILNRVIETYGWQWGYRMLGCLAVVIFIPLVVFFMKTSPSDIGQAPYVDKENSKDNLTALAASGVPKNKAIKTPTFIFLAIAAFIVGFGSMGGVQPHTMAYLTDVGYDSTFSSMMSSMIMVGMIVGKLGLGYIFDKIGAFRGAMINGAAGFFGVVFVIMAENSMMMAIIYGLTMGIACSGGTVTINYLTASYFGDLDFKRLLPLLTMAFMIGVSLGNPFSGLIFDLTGNYSAAWNVYLVATLIGWASFFLANKFSKRLEFETK